ncbi:MAG: hypothetical protein JKX84_10575 [Flavobacteriales bacterium]|nr:hypothetical protein [Flavobacteriales bacterium]
MKKYQFFKKKVFEGMEKYEASLNEECRKGWKPVSMTYDHTRGIVLLLEKTG